MDHELSAVAPPDDITLDRHMAGVASREEEAQIAAWLASDPDGKHKIDILRHALQNAASIARVTPSAASVWAQRVLQENAPTSATRDRAQRIGRWRRWAVAFAGLAIVIGLSGAMQWLGSLRFGSAPKYQSTYITANAERSTVILPDGSTVVLNVASRLDVSKDFERTRSVYLRGEALFTAVSNPAHPLTVVSGSSTTRVLGTTFAVRRYDSDCCTVVAVRNGKVMVGDVVLSAQQQVRVDPWGKEHVSDADMGQFTFANGVLTLENMSLVAAIPALNRWYDADIRIADTVLRTRGIRGAFPAGPITNLADLLEFMFNSRVERRGRTLTLYTR